MAITIRDADHGKELVEELAILKGHATRIGQIERALKEYLGQTETIKIYHDGKTMEYGAFESEGKRYPGKDIRNPCEWPKQNNLKIYLTLLEHGVSKGAAFGCFKCQRKEILAAVAAVNSPAFNAALADLADFTEKARFGFRTLGNEQEGETDGNENG